MAQQIANKNMTADRVQFTQAQIEYLESLYPEPVYHVGCNEADFMVRAIQRAVVRNIKDKLAKSSKGF